MTHSRSITRRSVLAGGAGLLLAAGHANAQSFPTEPVKIVVAVGPGSSPDVISRAVADSLTKLWGQQVIVFNQPGGAGAVAIRGLTSAPADGHTLYMSLASNYIALPELQKNYPVDVVRDFVPITYIGGHPVTIAVNPSLGVNSLSELVALMKSKPGELNVAAGNRGSILHLTCEWFRMATGTKFTMVHYAAAPKALADLLGGSVQVMFDAFSGMRGIIDSGKIKPLAVAAAKRTPDKPNVPTVSETIPGFEAVGWFALVAPPGTPPAVANKISEDVRKALNSPEAQKRFKELGTNVQPGTPAELTAFIKKEKETWRPVIEAASSKM